MNDFEKRYNNLVKEHIDTVERNENKAKEIKRLNDIINDLEKYKYAYESIIKSLKGNINFLKRNKLSKERIEEDTRIIRDLKFYYKNTEGDKE